MLMQLLLTVTPLREKATGPFSEMVLNYSIGSQGEVACSSRVSLPTQQGNVTRPLA